ncbi:MAG: cytochrome b562 [Roseibacillus sp.]|nr:cytochrome b562 [Roseibacillus sp.]
MKITQRFNVPAQLLALLALFLPTSFVAAEAEETPLEKQMAKISTAYKQLGRQARRETYDFDRLTTLFTEAKVATEKSAALVPVKIEKMTGAAKEKALEEYKKAMVVLLGEIDAVLASCKAKDGSKLKAAYDKLKKIKKIGHEEYIEDE